jgi:hypothetical protein
MKGMMGGPFGGLLTAVRLVIDYFLGGILAQDHAAPDVIQGTEGLFGAKTGEQKKAAAIHIADAVSTRRLRMQMGLRRDWARLSMAWWLA